MKIVVNEKTYNDSVWSFDHERGTASLILKTNESIAEVAETFDGNDTIFAYDDQENETGRWFVHAIEAIYTNFESRPAEEPRQIVVSIKASALSTEAEEALGNDINMNMEAIMELGALIADMADFETKLNNLEGIVNGIPKGIPAMFEGINNAYNALADRVAVLENKQ